MNALMEQWCDAPEQGIELTRSRAYQSNDQAWVEQKNGMLIRRVVGYERLVGLEAAQLLAELYAALRLFTNLFQPSFKLKSSVREGGRIKRQHHPPQTPLQQLLRTGVLSDQEAQGLRELRKRCDPVALLATMRSCQSRLALLISGQRASAMAGDPLSWRELEKFLQGLQALWRQSRPLQKKPKPRQGRRSRVDPFEAHADLIPLVVGSRSRCGQQTAPGAADRTGSRALWASTQTHPAATDQGLAHSQGAAMPGERSTATRNQARGGRKGVTRRQLKRVTIH
jgi:hypothetical protein